MASGKPVFPKTPTGIEGLDEITLGGFPSGRPVLICGGPGCGKTLMAMQFLVKGATEHNEPGVFMSFEEPAKDLADNVKSLGFNLDKLIADKKLKLDHVHIDRSEIEETGEYDLEALFIRLNYAIDSIGAKRVVLDTIETLFSGLQNQGVLRSEIRRLFHWLKEKGVTALITGEKGDTTFTRQGLEEYVSDCVILLDFRVNDQIATRRLRIVKYRGSTHGTNEYPFLIDEDGIAVLPITSLKLEHRMSNEIISTGLPSLDSLFYRGGMFRGTGMLISGSAGTAKTTLAAYFAYGSCLRNERTLYFSFEESPDQLIRNMKSVDIDLEKYVRSKVLQIHSVRPSLQGLEMHLLALNKFIKEFEPRMVILDPISSLMDVGSYVEVKSMLVRLMDMLKKHNITGIFLALTQNSSPFSTDKSEDIVSSLADTWIRLKNERAGLTILRSLHIVKARGMGHSGQPMEFVLSDTGMQISGSEPFEKPANNS